MSSPSEQVLSYISTVFLCKLILLAALTMLIYLITNPIVTTTREPSFAHPTFTEHERNSHQGLISGFRLACSDTLCRTWSYCNTDSLQSHRSLHASGKMVKKVCPCNQLCSNYLSFLHPPTPPSISFMSSPLASCPVACCSWYSH